jgi:hypothetical protein
LSMKAISKAAIANLLHNVHSVQQRVLNGL